MSLQSLLLACLAFGMTGCMPARYQVNIGNGHSTFAIRRIEVSVDGKEIKSFRQIGPNKLVGTKPRGGNLPDKIEVSWTDAQGNSYVKEVTVSDKVSPDFTGQLMLEITPQNTLSLSLVEAEETFDPLPWNLDDDDTGPIRMPATFL